MSETFLARPDILETMAAPVAYACATVQTGTAPVTSWNANQIPIQSDGGFSCLQNLAVAYGSDQYMRTKQLNVSINSMDIFSLMLEVKCSICMVVRVLNQTGFRASCFVKCLPSKHLLSSVCCELLAKNVTESLSHSQFIVEPSVYWINN